jgi:two-component system, OmpR family, response regulator ResD
MNRKTILVVDDEWAMRNLLKIHLSGSYKVIEASNGSEALSKLTNDVDLVLLDIMMPDMNGWDVCKRIRSKSQIPILMLTARGDIHDKAESFESGADDYVVKPFNIEELLMRINALIRRSTYNIKSHNQIQHIQKYKELKINPEERRVSVQESMIEMTPKEFDLLLYLALNTNKVFSREQLLDQIWGIHEVLDYRTVDTHIKNIREKLRRNKLSFNPIKTVWGVGYKFEEPDENQ